MHRKESATERLLRERFFKSVGIWYVLCLQNLKIAPVDVSECERAWADVLAFGEAWRREAMSQKQLSEGT